MNYVCPFDIIKIMRSRSWNVEQLKNAAQTSLSFRQLLAQLGLRAAGGNYAQIKKYIREHQVDIKHFKGRGWNAGMRGIGKPRIPLKEILVKNSQFQSFKLKKRLFVAGLKPQHCEQCGWAKQTISGHLPLELDHINGNRYDNRLKNLRVLCPNCHSLTENHRGRKNKKARVL